MYRLHQSTNVRYVQTPPKYKRSLCTDCIKVQTFAMYRLHQSTNVRYVQNASKYKRSLCTDCTKVQTFAMYRLHQSTNVRYVQTAQKTEIYSLMRITNTKRKQTQYKNDWTVVTQNLAFHICWTLNKASENQLVITTDSIRTIHWPCWVHVYCNLRLNYIVLTFLITLVRLFPHRLSHSYIELWNICIYNSVQLELGIIISTVIIVYEKEHIMQSNVNLFMHLKWL